MEDLFKSLLEVVFGQFGFMGVFVVLFLGVLTYGMLRMFKLIVINQNETMKNQNEIWVNGFAQMNEAGYRQATAIEKVAEAVTTMSGMMHIMKETHSQILTRFDSHEENMRGIETRLIQIENRLETIDTRTRDACDNTDNCATNSDVEALRREVKDILKAVSDCDSGIATSLSDAISKGLHHVEQMLSSGNTGINEIRAQVAELRGIIANHRSQDI